MHTEFVRWIFVHIFTFQVLECFMHDAPLSFTSNEHASFAHFLHNFSAVFLPGRVPEKWNAMHSRGNDNRITRARRSHATL